MQHIFTCLVCYCTSLPLEHNYHKGQTFCLFCSLLYPLVPEIPVYIIGTHKYSDGAISDKNRQCLF